MCKTNYPTNLTEKQWQAILVLRTKYEVENILNGKDRERKHSLREIFNAIAETLSPKIFFKSLPPKKASMI